MPRTSTKTPPASGSRRMCATLRVELSQAGRELNLTQVSELGGLILERHTGGTVMSEDRESHTLAEIETVWRTDELEALAGAVAREQERIIEWAAGHKIKLTWLATHLRELSA